MAQKAVSPSQNLMSPNSPRSPHSKKFETVNSQEYEQAQTSPALEAVCVCLSVFFFFLSVPRRVFLFFFYSEVNSPARLRFLTFIVTCAGQRQIRIGSSLASLLLLDLF